MDGFQSLINSAINTEVPIAEEVEPSSYAQAKIDFTEFFNNEI